MKAVVADEVVQYRWLEGNPGCHFGLQERGYGVQGWVDCRGK